MVGGVVAFVSLLIGLGPLNDNSFLTHLATGRIMWSTHHIPHSDPYSFTAPGKGWVVQSWLASLFYGAADNWWGPPGVLLLMGLSAAAVGALVWALTRPAGSLVGRLLVLIPVIVIGIDGGWVERPLLFGLIAMGLVLLAAEGRLDPRWLVPVMWVWVNTHGSFPLGLVALALFALGRRMDNESPVTELAALKWAAVGTALAAINPLGPRLLMFPAELLSRQGVLANVLEWQAPKFIHIGQRAFLAEVVLAIVLVARRPSWRTVLPLAVFTAAALLGARNTVVGSMVFIPGIARGLADLNAMTLTGEARRPIYRPAAFALAAVAVLSMIVAASGPVYSYNGYPVAAVTFAQRNGLLGADSRVVSRDFVGNYLEARYGTTVPVFIDDRYDMFPAAVVDDFLVLNEGHAGWEEVLYRYHASAVLWSTNEALGQLLAVSPQWRIVYSDQEFLIALPRSDGDR
ncbi:MAG: hypothetical protein QOI95_1835 [Acidimicrobiaceae bacterium]|jgi:hypothetical protein